MATPIRWDTIHRMASPAEASQPLEAARRSFQGIFDSLGTNITKAEDIGQANWQNTKINNTNAFLDQVAKYRTPEELKAAQASGALDSLRQQFGSQVDSNAIRGAEDARVLALQGQAKQNLEYESLLRNEKTAPLVDAYRAAVLDKDPVKAAAVKAQLEQAGSRDIAGLLAYQDNRARELTLRGYADTNQDLGVRKGEQEIKTSAAQIAHMANQDRLAQGQLALGRDTYALNLERTLDDRLAKNGVLLAGTYSQRASTEQGQAAIAAHIKSLFPNEQDQENARLATADFLKKNPDAPAAAVMAGITQMDTKHWWKLNALVRGDATQQMETALKAPGMAEFQKANAVRQALLQQRDMQMRQQLEAAQGLINKQLPGLPATPQQGAGPAAPVQYVPNPLLPDNSSPAPKPGMAPVDPGTQPYGSGLSEEELTLLANMQNRVTPTGAPPKGTDPSMYFSNEMKRYLRR